MKRILYALFILPLLLAGCYEDKGNYDYKDIQSIVIQEFEGVTQTIGDTIRVEPVFDIDVPENAPYLVYKWSLGEEVRPDDSGWNSRNFYWVSDRMVDMERLKLEVMDTRYGTKYLQYCICTIKGPFTGAFSWTILSEDESGRAMLSFFKTVDYEYISGGALVNLKEVKVYKDLYASVNQGKLLGKGALSMEEHYYRDCNVGNYWIFTGDGAVDLNGEGFSKDIDLDEAFMGGIPAGVTMQGGVCMNWVDVFYDQQGRLYTRVKLDEYLFNSGYFLPDPVSYKGEVLEQCQPVLGRYTIFGTGGYTPIIDRKNSRLLAIIDGGMGYDYENPWENAAQIIEFPSEAEDAPDNYIPLHDFAGYEIISMQYVLLDPFGWSNEPGFIILFKDASGHLYLEEFMLQRGDDIDGKSYLTISDVKVYDMGGLSGMPSLMATPPCTSSRYSFFAIGNQLAMFDRDTKTLTNDYKVFNAKITAMDGESDFTNKFMTVGLENGEFFVMNVTNAKNLAEGQRIMIGLPEGVRLGKIKKINYKIGNVGSWQ